MKFIIFILLYSGVLFAQSSLEQMTAIIRKAKSMEQFLKDDKLLDEYYLVANQYYQNKIVREEFDRVIKQILILGKKDPSIFARLEKSPDFKSYSIEVRNKSYGREVHSARFSQLMTKIRQEQKEKGSEFASVRDALLHIKDFQDLEFDMLDSLEGKSRKEQNQIRAVFYKQAKNDHLLQSALSLIIADAFWDLPFFANLLFSKEADYILLSFDELLTGEIIDHYGLPTSLRSFINSHLPSVDELLGNESVFPYAMKETHEGKIVQQGVTRVGHYHFVAFPMVFHSLWKNFCLIECVRENPKRWGIPLLSGVHSYAIERDGNYLGYLQEVPVKKEGKGIVYATEFGSEIFRNTVFIQENGKYVNHTFFDLWLKQVQYDYVRVKSEANIVDNAEVSSGFIQESSRHNLQVSFGRNKDFSVVDKSFAEFLIENANDQDFKAEIGLKSDVTKGLTFEMSIDSGFEDAGVFPLFIAPEEKLNTQKVLRSEKVILNKEVVPLSKKTCRVLMGHFN